MNNSGTKKDKTTAAILQLVAGGVSGIITKTFVAPLERLKILFQIQGMVKEVKYKSISQGLSLIYKEDGFYGFYRGNGANILRVIPVYALKFAFNDWFRNMVRTPGQKDSEMSFNQLMTSGILAGLFQQFITFPLEFLRTRLSLSQGFSTTQKYRGLLHCAVDVYKTEGPFAYYKGIGATLISGAPYVGLQMAFYEVFKRNVPEKIYFNDKLIIESSIFHKLICGALAGLVAQTISYPGDTVRKRMISNGIGGKPKHYKHSLDCLIQIYRKEGFRSFFTGMRTNVARCIPEAAIQFAAYEYLKTIFGV